MNSGGRAVGVAHGNEDRRQPVPAAARVDASCAAGGGRDRLLAGELGRCRAVLPADQRRHERASTVLTFNKGFEEWGGVLGDEVMAAALIDRVLHHCHIVNIRGNSYRMRAHQELFRPAPENRREGTTT